MKEGSPRPVHRIRKEIGSRTWPYFQKKYNLEVTARSYDHLSQANEHLKQSGLVIYLNHTSDKDVWVMVSLVAASLPESRMLLAPVGIRHYDFRRDFKAASGFRLLRLIDAHPIPVVQHREKDVYQDEERLRMLDKLKESSREHLLSPGSVYGYTPEGTRGKGQNLLRANRGFGRIPDYDPEHRLAYLPVGITYAEYGDPELKVGKPFRLPELIPQHAVFSADQQIYSQQLADLMMLPLADLLPPSNRGEYADPMPYLQAVGLDAL